MFSVLYYESTAVTRIITMICFSMKLNMKQLLIDKSNLVCIPCQNVYRRQNCARLHTNTVENITSKKKHCKTLGLQEKFTTTELRNAFLKLAKIYHPDSGNQQADADKFSQIESAYHALKSLHQEDNSELEDIYQTLEKDFGIKHTVPQHRQYLTYGGFGFGNPSEREHQYRMSRVDQATQNVFQHKVKKATVSLEKDIVFRDAALARQYKSRQAMERLVEDLIQASMARGEFDNLTGSGKPLKEFTENPYVDSTTHKLNQILISNGFTPEWIQLQKEIKEDRLFFRNLLRKRRAHLGSPPVNENLILNWISSLADLKEEISKLNKRIDKFNVIVPTLTKQQVHFHLESEARKVLKEDPADLTKSTRTEDRSPVLEETENKNILFRVFKYIKI